MPTYITLINWTEQGIREIKETGQRQEAAKKAIEDAGGKMIGRYFTMGRYDAVLITEFPSDEAAAAVFMGMGRRGYVRTESLRAFTEDQARDIIANIQ